METRNCDGRHRKIYSVASLLGSGINGNRLQAGILICDRKQVASLLGSGINGNFQTFHFFQ